MKKIKNYIENDRKEILEYFSENNFIQGSVETFISPKNECKVIKKNYKQNKENMNWVVSKIEIYDKQGNYKFDLLIDNDEFYHDFIQIESVEYLLFSEILCGGTSVLNLNSFKLSSFSEGTDGFIKVTYSISPGMKRLSSYGCIWAGQYFIKIFDISEIEKLPWKCTHEITSLEDGELSLEWISENKIKVRENLGNKKIQDFELEIM